MLTTALFAFVSKNKLTLLCTRIMQADTSTTLLPSCGGGELFFRSLALDTLDHLFPGKEEELALFPALPNCELPSSVDPSVNRGVTRSSSDSAISPSRKEHKTRRMHHHNCSTRWQIAYCGSHLPADHRILLPLGSTYTLYHFRREKRFVTIDVNGLYASSLLVHTRLPIVR